MTRPLHAIEADLQAARASHQAAEASRQKAVQVAADLRARVIGGDETIAAAELASAEHEAEHRALPIGSKLAAIQALEEELRTAETEEYAARRGTELPGTRSRLEQALAARMAVDDEIVEAWRVDAGLISRTALEVGTIIRPDVSPRVKRGPLSHGVVIDGVNYRPFAIHGWLDKQDEKTRQRLFSGPIKAQS